MKTALIRRKDYDFPDSEVFLIENQEDLKEYNLFTKRLGNVIFRKTMKSTCPMNKFDHLIPSSGPKRGIMTMALLNAQCNTIGVDSYEYSIFNNPLYHIFGAAEQKTRIFADALNDGEILLVNKNGGFFPYSPNIVEILKVYDTELKGDIPEIDIQYSSKWLALENGIDLSINCETYLKQNDPNYSVIYDLRNQPKDHVIKSIKLFIKNGGHTIFVSTTGSDVQQLYDYLELAEQIEIKRVVFYFVSGIDYEIREFLELAKKKINLEVVENLN